MKRIGIKAGMEGMNKEEIQKKIIEISKGSNFYQKEVEKEEKLKKRMEINLK
jgi:hypothetical protein